jgi:hypothetical protein
VTEGARAVVAPRPGVTVERGTAHTAARDPLLDHPYAIRFRGAPLDGGSTAGLDRDVIRRLVQAGIILEHDAIAFHTDTLAALVPALERLWAAHPGGFLIRDLAGAHAPLGRRAPAGTRVALTRVPHPQGESPLRGVAEADGNRTRRTGIARPVCFEDSEAHQVLVRLRRAG